MNLEMMENFEIEELIEKCKDELKNRKKLKVKEIASELKALLEKAHELDIEIQTADSFFLDEVHYNLDFDEVIEIRGWYV